MPCTDLRSAAPAPHHVPLQTSTTHRPLCLDHDRDAPAVKGGRCDLAPSYEEGRSQVDIIAVVASIKFTGKRLTTA